MLKAFLNDNDDIPWDAMNYMFAQINYGGRVTDDWDRILIDNMLKRFFCPDSLEKDYAFTDSGNYFIPDLQTLDEF